MQPKNTADNIEHLRHSLAHLLGAAVMELYPDAKLTLGPAIDDGFYYDVAFSHPLSSDALPSIETKMKSLLPTWTTVTHREVSKEEALDFYQRNEFKTELINEIAERGEKITLYTMGAFTDLCRGGHRDDLSTLDPDSFKLDRIAGAYWRGNEKNTSLTRIYGFAFESPEKLAEYLTMREEAEKRDHKKIGKEMGLFVFSDLVGSGLPLWTPKGTFIRETLNDYVWELRKARGFERVTIPHITKKDLYETSGHWAKFSEELFKIETREGHLFAMKPMNCPHHTQIFDSSPKSYRDMPQRYSETTMVYRDEQSGELSGLSRVRSITQDDAHVFCRETQIEEEMLSIWDIIDSFYGTFGFELQVRFSRHDPTQFEKYIGTPEIWAKAEEVLKSVIVKRHGNTFIDGLGEAAMYGPKIDFIAKDAIGRTLQVATIQLDFNMPTRFELTCTNEKGEKETIVMIHCAIMGSIERFMSTLIEHTTGHFPVWLAPVQVAVLPISEKQSEYAKSIKQALEDKDIRVTLLTGDSLGKRIRSAKTDKIPYQIVIGDKEKEAGTVTVEGRAGLKLEGIALTAFIDQIVTEIRERANK